MTVKQSTKIKYRVPAWENCNCHSGSYPIVNKVCRFAAKDVVTGMWYCSLYNEQLVVNQQIKGSKIPLLCKVRICQKSTAGYKQSVKHVYEEEQSDISTKQLDYKTIATLVLKEYDNTINDLIRQGIPAHMAQKIAKQDIIGGK